MAEKSLKKNAILNVFRSILTLLFPLITFPYASRILLPEGIGKVNFATQTVGIFSIISSLGFSTYAMREAAKIRDDKEKLGKFCSQIITLNIITTILSYILLFSAVIFIPKYSSYKTLILTLSSTILFNTIGISWLYTALEDYKYITIQHLLFHTISLILLFVLVKDESDYIQYALLTVISSAGSGLMNFIHARKYIKLSFVKPNELKVHIKPIIILSGITIAASVYNLLDVNMLGFFSTNSEIGIYTAAIKAARIILSLLGAVYGVMIPRLSYYANEGAITEEYTKMVGKSINIIEIICIPSMIGLIILSEPIIILLCGTEYRKSIMVMQVISPIVFFVLSGGVLGDTVFTPLRKDKLNLYPVIAGAMVNIIFNSLLIPKYGSLGAAIGTVIAESSVNIIKFIFAQEYIKNQGFYSEIWKYFVSAIIMGICLLFIMRFVKTPILQIITGLTIGGTTYFISLKLFHCKFLKEVEEIICRTIRKAKEND